MHTLKTIFKIDSSVQLASLRMARNADIRTVSSLLDHSCSQVCRSISFMQVTWDCDQTTDLGVQLDALTIAGDVRH